MHLSNKPWVEQGTIVETQTLWTHYNENVVLIKQMCDAYYSIVMTGCDDYANWSASVLCFIVGSRTTSYFKYLSAVMNSAGYNGGSFVITGYGPF